MKKLYLSYTLNGILLIALAIVAWKSHAGTAKISFGKYLEETIFCDFNHPIFDTFSVDHADSDTEIAVEVFKYVRDKFTLGSDRLDVKASETMTKNSGACWNKALVMTALLRKNSIPCEIVKVPLYKNFLKPLAGEDVNSLIDTFYHCFVRVYIDSQWVFADPSLDNRSYENAYRPLNLEWDIDWDGRSDQIIHQSHILGPIETIEDIDASYSSTIGNYLFEAYLKSAIERL